MYSTYMYVERGQGVSSPPPLETEMFLPPREEPEPVSPVLQPPPHTVLIFLP